ncbi:methyl-accepting chemotaxis protein [Elysia marginata]|uniref:Methyl-accepting chemotaxis protein n=1 Tax=Elysia marginata TaxID=1093978 RepID=A0AAV4JUL5_9GAST|nr:methyl-accepting chemotaxis protein [Elysia marginata]
MKISRRAASSFIEYYENTREDSEIPAPTSAGKNSWRIQEAHKMFTLMREEYEESKKFSIPRRYREMKRIIRMFTAEPITEKLRYLSTAEAEVRHSRALLANRSRRRSSSSAILRSRCSGSTCLPITPGSFTSSGSSSTNDNNISPPIPSDNVEKIAQACSKTYSFLADKSSQLAAAFELSANKIASRSIKVSLDSYFSWGRRMHPRRSRSRESTAAKHASTRMLYFGDDVPTTTSPSATTPINSRDTKASLRKASCCSKKGQPDTFRKTSFSKQRQPDTFRKASCYKQGPLDTFRKASCYKQGPPDTFRKASFSKQGHSDTFRKASFSKQGQPDTFRKASFSKQGQPDTFRKASCYKQRQPDTLREQSGSDQYRNAYSQTKVPLCHMPSGSPKAPAHRDNARSFCSSSKPTMQKPREHSQSFSGCESLGPRRCPFSSHSLGLARKTSFVTTSETLEACHYPSYVSTDLLNLRVREKSSQSISSGTKSKKSLTLNAGDWERFPAHRSVSAQEQTSVMKATGAYRCDGCVEYSDVTRDNIVLIVALDSIVSLRSDFNSLQLQGLGLFQRYKRMKAMLKSCMKVLKNFP